MCQDSTSTSLGLDGNVIGLGIWLDGVGCKWDTSSSIEMINLSLLGVTGRWRALRLPVACILREWMMKALRNRDWKRNAPSQFHFCLYCGAFNFQTRLRNTIRRLVCCGGLIFAVRSSGAVAKHKARKQRVSGERRKEATTCQQLPIKALLVHDNERAGCCCMCRNADEHAPWRQQRMTHGDVFGRMVRQGRSVSPIFEAPGVKVAIFRVDWLHCVDLGIAADWLGEFMVNVLPKLPGRSHAARISVL